MARSASNMRHSTSPSGEWVYSGLFVASRRGNGQQELFLSGLTLLRQVFTLSPRVCV